MILPLSIELGSNVKLEKNHLLSSGGSVYATALADKQIDS